MTKLSSPTVVVTKPAKPLSGVDKMDVYFDAVSKTFAKKLQDVLPKITAGAWRRLAIRNYVHFAARVSSRWAMTSAEETEFKKTATYQTLESERKKIFKKFAQQNKGYSLRAPSRARSLETQIRFWNGNSTVKSIGKNLGTKALAETGRKTYPDVPTDADVAKFKKWLKTTVRLSGSPTHARIGILYPQHRHTGRQRSQFEPLDHPERAHTVSARGVIQHIE